jgi:hypothetical protein
MFDISGSTALRFSSGIASLVSRWSFFSSLWYRLSMEAVRFFGGLSVALDKNLLLSHTPRFPTRPPHFQKLLRVLFSLAALVLCPRYV